MSPISEAMAAALRHQQAGRLQESQQAYLQIVNSHPDCAEGWHQLGGLASQSGDFELARACFGRALALQPDSPELHSDFGTALQMQGRFADAVACFRRALKLKPDVAALHFNLGNALAADGKPGEAVACYLRALQLQPELAIAHYNLGTVLQDLGRLDEATSAFQRALAIAPKFAEAYGNLGLVFQQQGKLDEAAGCYRQSLEINPGNALAQHHLGTVFFAEGKLGEAIDSFRRALQLKPDYAEAHSHLGTAWRLKENFHEAVVCCRRAVELKPEAAATHNALGTCYLATGELDQATASFRRAVELNPADHEAHSNLGNALKDQARLDEALACYRRAIQANPRSLVSCDNLLYALYFSPDYDAAAIFAEHRHWNEQHARPLAASIQPHANDRNPNRRIRVGYVSPDFRNHVQAFFSRPLLAAHDRQQFEIFCYADVAAPDGITDWLRTYADGWRDIIGLSDEQIAQMIRQDQIDILIDLTMHMEGCRPLLFARKPAPVQVCWLAYPGTTGLSAIDYRLTDPQLDPPGLDDGCYSEESIRLPETFWCYDPFSTEPAVGPLPALANGFLTFGSLNNFCKVNQGVLKLWARVLGAVDRSRLILLSGQGSHRQTTLDFLQQEGIAPERITFLEKQPRRRYLELYHQIDIGLDTFPYNGHTTSLDAYWMGVPVVTIAGRTAVGRAGVSQLTNLGLPELIAKTPDRFLEIARGLASDLDRLCGLRGSLRDRMLSSPLMDGPRFARNIESAYRAMWQRWCARQP